MNSGKGPGQGPIQEATATAPSPSMTVFGLGGQIALAYAARGWRVFPLRAGQQGAAGALPPPLQPQEPPLRAPRGGD
ncbi:hypothetical protein QFZ76_007361 [Streptomyces sp. V4I2]|nr:hypothetical protein [Streptomyces sp. V4I2]